MHTATWFCVDIECSGPVPGLYDMLSVGIVVVHDRQDTPAIGASMLVEIAPVMGGVDPGAMEVNRLDLADLKENGASMASALAMIDAFVEEHVDTGTAPVFVGHNAPFDWSFVNHAYVSSGRHNPFGYKAFDTKAFAAGVLDVHWLATNKEMLAEVLDLPEQDPQAVHRADYDAWYQALILIALLKRSRERHDRMTPKG